MCFLYLLACFHLSGYVTHSFLFLSFFCFSSPISAPCVNPHWIICNYNLQSSVIVSLDWTFAMRPDYLLIPWPDYGRTRHNTPTHTQMDTHSPHANTLWNVTLHWRLDTGLCVCVRATDVCIWGAIRDIIQNYLSHTRYMLLYTLLKHSHTLLKRSHTHYRNALTHTTEYTLLKCSHTHNWNDLLHILQKTTKCHDSWFDVKFSCVFSLSPSVCLFGVINIPIHYVNVDI